MALTAARKTAETEGRIIVLEAASAIFAGALVVANDSGKAAAATKAASLTALGRAENDAARAASSAVAAPPRSAAGPACTSCGAVNAPGTRFCGSCGAKLR